MATQKKYVCAFCARAFTRSEHKQRHERSHTNEKPFHCVHCTSSFVRRDLLQRHCRTVHNIQLTNSNSPTTKPAVSTERMRSPVTCDNSLVHLLSVTKKLQTLLVSYNPELNFNSNLNDSFLIGYTYIAGRDDFPVFDKMCKDLVDFLNTSNSKSRSTDFKVCLIYSIIAAGFANNQNEKECVNFFNKSWSLLILKLIPRYNNNVYNTEDQTEILRNLFVLAFINLSFNLNDHQPNPVSGEIIFEYLNEISYIIITNLSSQADHLINDNLHLFWSTYMILSRYFINAPPPKIFKFFLEQEVANKSLRELMRSFTKSIDQLSSKFVKETIVMTLYNEINQLIHHNELCIYDSKNSLHNAIILINKSVNQMKSNFEIFELFKKKLIIGSPLKFHDLLNNYIFSPSEMYNWNLLMISLKEFNIHFDFSDFYSRHLNTVEYDSFESGLMSFFQDFEINNNLVIVSFPLIFNLNLIKLEKKKMKLIDISSYSSVELFALNAFIMEWYLTMIKVLIKLFREKDYNYVMQNLIFLVLENSFDDVKLNDQWFWFLKFKFDTFLENWLDFFNYNTHKMVNFKMNTKRFVTNLIRTSLNFSPTIENSSNEMTRRSHSISLASLQSQNAIPSPKVLAIPNALAPSTSILPPDNYYSAYTTKNPQKVSFPIPSAYPLHNPHPNDELVLPPIIKRESTAFSQPSTIELMVPKVVDR